MPVARLRSVARSEADAVAVGFQRLEQRLALNDLCPAFLTPAVLGQGAPQREFEIAARVAGGQGPEFALLTVDVRPGFDLAGTCIGQPGVVGDHRAGGMGRRPCDSRNDEGCFQAHGESHGRWSLECHCDIGVTSVVIKA